MNEPSDSLRQSAPRPTGTGCVLAIISVLTAMSVTTFAVAMLVSHGIRIGAGVAVFISVGGFAIGLALFSAASAAFKFIGWPAWQDDVSSTMESEVTK